MNRLNLSRRQFLAAALLAAPAGLVAEAKGIEPTWLKIRHLRLGRDTPAHRFVHFSDVHHKGDRRYLQLVVDTINSLSPDFICFTGDIVENDHHLAAALEILSGLRAPLFGVPGNHDFSSGIPLAPVRECFARTGGAWFMDESRLLAGGRINLIGLNCLSLGRPIPPSQPQARNILLMHYPVWAKRLRGRTFDLLLAGHSHGGQVRIPFYGAIVVPFNVDQYDLGLFQTEAGPLYVNPGIGYIGDYNFRFNCRPEITVIEV